MSNYPGDIPLRGSIGFIMFDDLKEYIVTIPQGAVLRAWPKLRELERRWLYFEWFTHGVAKKPEGFRSLLDDAASAYLMTFEAVIQMMGDQIGETGHQLTAWLEALPSDAYDLTCRGLRTLRNIEAHVRPGNLERVGNQLGASVFASGADPGHTLPWCFAALTPNELPRTSHLTVAELSDWQALVESNLAAKIMRDGVQRLYAIAQLGEKELTGP